MLLKARLRRCLIPISHAVCTAIAVQACGGDHALPEDMGAGESKTGARSAWSLMRHEFEFLGAAGSEADLSSRESSSYSETFVRAGYTVLAPLSKEMFLRLGLGYGAFFFDFDGTDRFPDQVHRLNLVLGGGVSMGERLKLFISANPGIYSDLEDVSWEDVTATALAGAIWTWSEAFQLVLGLRVTPVDKYPVLPLAGFKWQIGEQWSVNVMYPRPAIEFRVAPWLQLYTGADIRGANYRVSESFQGTTPDGRSLANQWLGYSHVSAVAGASFQISKQTHLDIGGGYVFHRKFDYSDVDFSEEVEEGAFIVQAGVKVSF